MRKVLSAVFFLICCFAAVAQQAMNNDAVIKMVKAGLSDDVIVATVSSSAGTYDTTANGLIALKQAGASDRVIAAVIGKATNPAPPPSPAPLPPPAAATQPPAPSAASVPPPLPPFHSTDGKIRVYVTDHPIFESTGIVKASGDRHGASAAGVSHTQAGDDPRTVEVQADILKVCPPFIIASNNPDRSDYVLVFRRRGGERSSFFAFGGLAGLALSAASKVDGASLFQNDGDMVYATKQNTVEKAIRDVCTHIPPVVPPPASSANPPQPQMPAPAAAPAPPPASAPAQ